MQNLPHWLGFTLAVVMLISACALFFYVERRKFYRRNEAGVEEFKSFTSSILSLVFEKALFLAAAIIALVGVFQFFMHGIQLFF
jgi:Na+/melibiose symporter-like transporter